MNHEVVKYASEIITSSHLNELFSDLVRRKIRSFFELQLRLEVSEGSTTGELPQFVDRKSSLVRVRAERGLTFLCKDHFGDIFK